MDQVTYKDVSIKVTKTDDPSTVRDKLCLKIEHTLPSFFIIEGEKALCIKDELTTEVSPQRVRYLMHRYPLISRGDLIFLWANVIPEARQDIRKVFRFDILDNIKHKSDMEDYYKTIANTRREIQNRVNSRKQHIALLKDVKPYPISEPKVIESTTQFVITFENDLTLVDIFNRMHSTPDLPFIRYRSELTDVFKVYKNFIPAEMFLTEKFPVNNIFLAIIVQKRTFACTLTSSGVLLVTARKAIPTEDIKRIFEKATEGSHIGTISTLSMRAEFEVEIDDFSPILFSDTLMTERAINWIFSIYEKDVCVSKKKRFTFSYHPISGAKDAKTTMSVVSIPSREGTILRIRMRKVSSMLKVRCVSTFVGYALSFYKYKKLLKLYRQVIPDLKPKILVSSKKLTKKTGDKLKPLEDDTFKGIRFPKKCSRGKQPAPVDPSKLKDIPEHKRLEFPAGSGRWYSCPVENGNFEWIGLQRIKPGGKTGPKEMDVPMRYVPCCFLMDQFTKKGSALTEYLSGTQQRVGGAHVVKYKALQRNTEGRLPLVFENLIKTISKSDSRYVRYGVSSNPDTAFVECLEIATEQHGFDPDAAPHDGRRKLASGNLAVALQGNPGQSLDMIKEVIKKGYIDPLKFIDLGAHVYGVNIIMFVTDGASVSAAVPFSSGTYIHPPWRDDRPYIVCMLEKSGEKWLSEIVMDKNIPRRPDAFRLQDEKVIDVLRSIYEESYRIV